MNIFFEWIFGILKEWIIFFEWIFWIAKKGIFVLNEYSRFLKKKCFEWILWIFIKRITLNKYIGFSLSASKTVVTKCLKLIWNYSGIISGTLFSPFQGVYYLYRGLRRALKPYFGLILEFWIIFLIFLEWIILLNILNSIEWIFFWMNILDFVLNWILNWIIFRPDSMKKWIFKTYRTGLTMVGMSSSHTSPLSTGSNQRHSGICTSTDPANLPKANCFQSTFVSFSPGGRDSSGCCDCLREVGTIRRVRGVRWPEEGVSHSWPLLVRTLLVNRHSSATWCCCCWWWRCWCWCTLVQALVLWCWSTLHQLVPATRQPACPFPGEKRPAGA